MPSPDTGRSLTLQQHTVGAFPLHQISPCLQWLVVVLSGRSQRSGCSPVPVGEGETSAHSLSVYRAALSCLHAFPQNVALFISHLLSSCLSSQGRS